jgi:protein-S-isoprenylcysteine O-methyltransferase Ste14
MVAQVLGRKVGRSLATHVRQRGAGANAMELRKVALRVLLPLGMATHIILRLSEAPTLTAFIGVCLLLVAVSGFVLIVFAAFPSLFSCLISDKRAGETASHSRRSSKTDSPSP